jgi:3-isopropylmalate/(R)-2-methylmalate dehydratase small subunit
MKSFGGPVLFLNRDDINTDEIIPARYLTEIDKPSLKPYLLEDLKLDGFDRASERFKNARVIVTRKNFGCGSSREHAPWALEVNDISAVIAESYARIFRQNMFNCGLLAIELPAAGIDRIFTWSSGAVISCDVSLDRHLLTFRRGGAQELQIAFVLAPFDEALVKAGGWVGYANAKY